MQSFKLLLDISDDPKDHFLHNPTHKTVPVTLTDVLQGKILREFVCLLSKLNSMDYLGGLKQSAEGVRKQFERR